MEANKIILNSEVLIDLTEDTATEDKVLEGYTFHKADGTIGTGTATGGSGNPYADILDNQASANKGLYLFSGSTLTNQELNDNLEELADDIKTVEGMFNGCSNLTSIDFGDIALGDAQAVSNIDIDFNALFKGATSLEEINWGNLFDNIDANPTRNRVNHSEEMFSGCTNLDEIILNFNMSNIAGSRKRMFYNCSNLTSLSLPTDFFSSDCSQMFFRCKSFITLDLGNLHTANGGDNFTRMFEGQNGNPMLLETIKWGANFEIGERSIRQMFKFCTSLSTINYYGTVYDWKNKIKPYATLFNNTENGNNLPQSTITVYCTNGELVYTNNGNGNFSITETITPFVLQDGNYYADGDNNSYYTFDTSNNTWTSNKGSGTYTRQDNDLALYENSELLTEFTITSNTTLEQYGSQFTYQA